MLRRVSGANPVNTVSVLAEVGKADQVWGELNQHALNSDDRRFVVVRNAERVEHWEQFEDWMNSRQAPNVRTVFVANEKQWPTARHHKARERVIRSSQAFYVECVLPKSNPGPSAVEAILAWGRLTEAQALHLARRTGYNLAQCRDVCQWVDMLPGEVTTQVLDLLSQETSIDGFVGALVKQDKAQAATLAQRLSRAEQTAAVGGLAQRLLDLDRVHRALSKAALRSSDLQQVRADTARMADVKLDRVIELWDAARHYDARTVQHRSELLVLADAHKGEPGVMERLVLEW